jgi:hypothetical protein
MTHEPASIGEDRLRCHGDLIIPARVVDGPTLRPQNNELVFGVSGDGAVTFGDVVILYTSNELTVKVPIVLSS